MPATASPTPAPHLRRRAVRVALDYRPALLGGAGLGRATRELARALAPRDDVQLHLFGHCLRRSAGLELPPVEARLHRLPLPGRSLKWLAKVGLDATRLSAKPQVFHWTDTVFPPVRQGHPTALTVHDLAFLADSSFHGEAVAAGLASRVLDAVRQASVCIVPSVATTDALANATRDAQVTPMVRVIPFGCDHVHRIQRQNHGLDLVKRQFFMALGTIEPRKNHRRLLHAWTALPSPKPDLVVVGRRGWQCQQTCEELQAAQRSTGNQAPGQGRVLWLENLNDGQVASLLDTARALVYPSLLEGFGFPPLEAMALGLPVITGSHGALVEAAGEAAWMVDGEDTGALTDSLDRLAKDESSWEALRTAGLERAKEFTWQACATEHAAVYGELAR